MGTITTYTGIEFAPLSPRLEDIDIRDIAHALSNLCRFTGHCPKFYSVAEHSVLVSLLVPIKYALGGLLHDGSEAYLNDIAGPIKPFFSEYNRAEAKLQNLIHLKWTIGGDEQFAAIKAADQHVLRMEQDALFKNKRNHFIECLSPENAKAFFMQRFNQLTSS